MSDMAVIIFMICSIEKRNILLYSGWICLLFLAFATGIGTIP